MALFLQLAQSSQFLPAGDHVKFGLLAQFCADQLPHRLDLGQSSAFSIYRVSHQYAGHLLEIVGYCGFCFLEVAATDQCCALPRIDKGLGQRVGTPALLD